MLHKKSNWVAQAGPIMVQITGPEKGGGEAVFLCRTTECAAAVPGVSFAAPDLGRGVIDVRNE